MFELIVATRSGAMSHIGVRDWNEACAELSRFEREYLRNHPNDEIIDASVLDSSGNRVSRYYRGQLEVFN